MVHIRWCRFTISNYRLNVINDLPLSYSQARRIVRRECCVILLIHFIWSYPIVAGRDCSGCNPFLNRIVTLFVIKPHVSFHIPITGGTCQLDLIFSQVRFIMGH